MPSRMIGTTLLSAGLVVVLSGPRVATWVGPDGPAPADTVSTDRLAEVTMEPIRVVVTPDERWDEVTMEPIRVVIPLEPDEAPR